MDQVKLSELMFTNDMVVVGATEKDLQLALNIMHRELRNIDMKINVENPRQW